MKKQSLVEVQLVVSNNSKAKGLTIAKKNKIPFIHFIPRKNFENKVMKYLKNIDIICLAGFMQVLEFLKREVFWGDNLPDLTNELFKV